jgi:hypothetical protein
MRQIIVLFGIDAIYSIFDTAFLPCCYLEPLNLARLHRSSAGFPMAIVTRTKHPFVHITVNTHTPTPEHAMPAKPTQTRG